MGHTSIKVITGVDIFDAIGFWGTLLAIIDKYGVRISQWAGLYQPLLEVSMNKIALWINICTDDWTAERAIILSNEVRKILVY